MSGDNLKRTLSSFEYEHILKAIPSLLYVINPQEELIACSDAILSLLEIDQAASLQGSFYHHLLQKSQWLDIRVQSLRQTDLEVLAAQATQYQLAEPPVTDARGLVFYYEATRLPLKNAEGELVGLIVNLVDISARKILEAQLHKDNALEAHKPKTRSYPPNVQRDPNKPPKILLIEDNILAQEASCEILRALSCQIELATSSAEVDQVFKPGLFDFILMDIGLEGTSGYLIAKHIRQIESNSGYQVPIIALTSFDADLVKTDCDYYFMEGAITKPLMHEQARQMIQRYVYDTPVMIKGLKSLKYAG